MRAVDYDRNAGIDQLYIAEVPAPISTPRRVIVRVRASCINPGSLAALHGATFKPIRDLAGDVVSVGDGVQTFAIGDEVLGWSDDSAHAELASVPVDQLVAKPAALA